MLESCHGAPAVNSKEAQRSHNDRTTRTDGAVDFFVGQVQELYSNQESSEATLRDLEAKNAQLLKQQARLLKWMREDDAAPDSLLSDLKGIEKQLAENTVEMEHLNSRPEVTPELTKQSILEALEQHRASLLEMQPEVASTLSVLIPNKIKLVPYLQFQTLKVVPRAEFELHLTKLLPFDLQVGLDPQKLADQGLLEPIKLVVDLYEPSFIPKHALALLELYEAENISYCEIARRLGTSNQNVCRAVKYGKAMREAGITDPYIRLTEAPDLGKRWRLNYE